MKFVTLFIFIFTSVVTSSPFIIIDGCPRPTQKYNEADFKSDCDIQWVLDLCRSGTDDDGTPRPTSSPTKPGCGSGSCEPTNNKSPTFTGKPTEFPTFITTEIETTINIKTNEPTNRPSGSPSGAPSQVPSDVPSTGPSKLPSSYPTWIGTGKYTRCPNAKFIKNP